MLSRHVVGHPRSCGWQASAVVVLAAEHAGPHLYELRLVEVTVVVRVKHVDEVARHRLVEAHQLLKHPGHLLLAQHPVPVAIQLVETSRYLVVTAHITPQNKYKSVSPASATLAVGGVAWWLAAFVA